MRKAMLLAALICLAIFGAYALYNATFDVTQWRMASRGWCAFWMFGTLFITWLNNVD